MSGKVESYTEPAQLQPASPHHNTDLIETDEELLEVGSNERPDGSDEEEDEDEDDYDDDEDEESRRPLDFTVGRQEGAGEMRGLKRLAEQQDCDNSAVSQLGPAPTGQSNKKKGVKSFCIDDILSHKTAALEREGPGGGPGIVRPWDHSEGGGQQQRQQQRRKSQGDSPLDALFNMASNFEALKAKSGKTKNKSDSCSFEKYAIINSFGRRDDISGFAAKTRQN